jgi:hypothetical protein
MDWTFGFRGTAVSLINGIAETLRKEKYTPPPLPSREGMELKFIPENQEEPHAQVLKKRCCFLNFMA